MLVNVIIKIILGFLIDLFENIVIKVRNIISKLRNKDERII